MWEKEIVEGGFSLVSPIPLEHQLFSSIPCPARLPCVGCGLGGAGRRKNGMHQMKTGFGGRGLRKILHLTPSKAIWVVFGGSNGDALS
jgi:hypothetical protein